MSAGAVVVEKAGGVLILTLNRPTRLNALTAPMHGELRSALALASDDETVRAVLLTGAGHAFCAGQDLAEVDVPEPGVEPDLGATVEAYYNPLVRQLRALEKPIVCAVNGAAAGAGANIALACDIVVAGERAKFAQVFTRIGLVPDSGGTFLLPRLVGPARAAGLMMLAESVSAAEAERMGMIWRVVPDEALLEEATNLASRLAQMPTRALALIKRALNASLENGLSEQLDLERDCQRAAGRTADYVEGLKAFFDKRRPEFQGR
ncbi:MAG: 2-(1,2-epoxy-1,2-dihydrophenyl)acetyl-CoA isomerase PaaG [Sandaracinaceae bacterium]